MSYSQIVVACYEVARFVVLISAVGSIISVLIPVGAGFCCRMF